MAASPILTGGFGTYGSAALVPTLGFSAGEAGAQPPPEGVGSFDVVSRGGSSDTMTVGGGSADVIDYGIPG